MFRHPRPRRALFAALALGALAAGVGAVPAAAAPAAPGALAAPASVSARQPLVANGPFSASADASYLTVDFPALSPALLPATNVDVARSTAVADSASDVDAVDSGTQRTAAVAGSTGTSTLLGQPLAVQEVRASAPPSEHNEGTNTNIPADPLFNVDTLNTVAEANWISDTQCVASDTPLSFAVQSATEPTTITPGADQPVVDVTAGVDQAVGVVASTNLPATGGADDRRTLAATVSTNLAGADLLNNIVPGIDQLIDVAVLQQPNYTVQASGLPGGASVTGTDAVVSISIAGQTPFTLGANEQHEADLTDLTLAELLGGQGITDLVSDLGLDPATPLADLLDGALEQVLDAAVPVVRLSMPVAKAAAADGTSASVSASLLRVELLAPSATGDLATLADTLDDVLGALGLDEGQSLGQLDLVPLSAAVAAPVGGITCADENPLELQKVNSGPAIPGSTFDYTIAVGNTGDCTLTNVVVTDTLTGPAGSTIVTTEPTATVTPASGGFALSWTLPDLAPDARTTLRIRVQVPAGAQAGQRYDDHVAVQANCEGQPPVQRTFDLPEPEVETVPGGTCNISGSTKSASHVEVYRGEQFAYFVNLYNGGGTDCTDVVVTDTLIPQVTFVSCSDGCAVSGQTLTWNVGTLKVGQSITFRVVVQVNADASGNLPNTARATTHETGPHDMSTPGPIVTERSILAPNDPATTPGRTRSLSRTGSESMWLLGLSLGLGALALQRTKRRLRLS